MSSDVTLVAEDLGFAYGDRSVLASVSLALGAGRICALLGPNGAGKSTLIRLLCGRLAPATGRVRVGGEDPARSASARRRIGLVPQQIALYPHLGVGENLRAFARLAGLGRSEARRACDRAVRTCDLGEVVGRRVGTLSGGWQRRTNIACGIVHGPEVLILDEPTVGVDLPARLAIERVLRALAEEGMAILMTSHDLEEMGRLCDRVAFLDAGRLVAEGSPASLIHDVFADRREWQVTLDALPDDELAETLAGLGLQPEDPNAPLQWRGLAGAIDVDALDALPAIEWRVRRPGLDSLWHRLFGCPPETPS